MAKEALKAGKKAPAFKLEDQDGEKTALKDFNGSWVILYFYPKDSTPGCTIEALDFSRDRALFKRAGAEILGISPDSVKSHAGFREKKKLTITLLSDPEHSVTEKFGCWQNKKLYGREFMGVVRSTFLINPDGKIVSVWSPVKVKGHSQEVLTALKAIKKS